MNSKKWNNEEINFLKLNYNLIPIKEIVEKLNRSYNSIVTKAYELNINKKNINSNCKNKTTKTCVVCKKEYPKTKEFFDCFVTKRENKLIYQTKCRTCYKNYIYKRNSTLLNSFKNIIRTIKKQEKRLKNGFNIDIDFLMTLWENQKGTCALSGINMTYLKGKGSHYYSNVSIDRIDSNKGYTKDNVWLVCIWANTAKSNLIFNHFKEMIKITNNYLTLNFD